jgi:hypothetical protein
MVKSKAPTILAPFYLGIIEGNSPLHLSLSYLCMITIWAMPQKNWNPKKKKKKTLDVPSFHDNVFTSLKLGDFQCSASVYEWSFRWKQRGWNFMNTNLPFIPLSLSSTSLKCLASITQFITFGKLDNKWGCNLLGFHLSSIVSFSSMT